PRNPHSGRATQPPYGRGYPRKRANSCQCRGNVARKTFVPTRTGHDLLWLKGQEHRGADLEGGGHLAKDLASLFRSPASVLAPSSVAIVGASERGQWQGMIYRNLRDYKYPGRVFLVNPRQQEVWGERCFPSLRELPERVDHVMVIVPAAAVASV